MMGSRRVSLAIFSIFLTLVHSFSHASVVSVPAQESHVEEIAALEGSEKSLGTGSCVQKIEDRVHKVRRLVGFREKIFNKPVSQKEPKAITTSFKKRKKRASKASTSCVRKLCVKGNQEAPGTSVTKVKEARKKHVVNIKVAEPKPQLKTVVVRSEEEPEEKSVVADASKEGPVLPIFVLPDVKKIVQEANAKAVRNLIKEQRVAQRKSSREALKARLKDKQIVRDGSVTSTLRYNVKKAAEIREKRNASVNSQLRLQKASQKRRDAHEVVEKNTEESTEPTKALPKVNRHQVSHANIDSYADAKQYRCDSSSTDWPCSSCVSKRRANIGISVCTIVVTVVAMILGAVIIAHASDSTTNTSTGSGSAGGSSSSTPTAPAPSS